jgi:hypothetical protein
MRAATTNEQISEQCAELAIETLQQAVAAGLRLPADLRSNESFALLRDRKSFARLVEN